MYMIDASINMSFFSSGMFMVKLQLFDKSGGTVSSSSRSVSVGENSYQPSISTAFPSCAKQNPKPPDFDIMLN